MLAPLSLVTDPIEATVAAETVKPARPEMTVAIRQGATRCLVHAGYAPIWEFALANNRRADICGLGHKGELVIVEVKSGVEDYRADHKWREYAPFCDRFYFAVAPCFPLSLIPDTNGEAPGLIVGDAFGAEIIRPAPHFNLPPARRKAVTISFARHAALRGQRS
ncbi:MAG: hypothetical protein RL186_1678 [Pseudomonadota bacterium]|jgi:hypothetical protein